MAENKKQEVEKKTPGQKLDEKIDAVKNAPKTFAEKHPKLIKILKIGGTLAAGAGIVILGDAVVDHFSKDDDDEDAIDVDATVVPIEDGSDSESESEDETTEA